MTPMGWLDLNSNNQKTLLSLQTNTDTCVNSADPDEMPYNEPSHQNQHCLPFCYWFWLKPLFATMNVSKFRDGRVHVRNLRIIGLRLLRKCISHFTNRVDTCTGICISWKFVFHFIARSWSFWTCLWSWSSAWNNYWHYTSKNLYTNGCITAISTTRSLRRCWRRHYYTICSRSA